MIKKHLRICIIAFFALCGCGVGSQSESPAVSVADTSPAAWSFQFSPHAPQLVPFGSGFQFSFPDQDGVHYLVTNQRPAVPLTLLTTATIETTGAPVFDYHTNPNNTCDSPATFRLYFQRRGDILSGQGQYEFYRWWNVRAGFAPLARGTHTLLGDLTNPADWISIYGKKGTETPEAFRDAVNDIGAMGVTFGGGCFFGHGVFVTGGSATFKLKNFIS